MKYRSSQQSQFQIPFLFVYGVTNFPHMVRSLRNIVDDDQYTTKCMADNTVKINSTTPETYRSLIRHMQDNNVIHHTYQSKEARAYRIVLKHVHHSVNITNIKIELEGKGHAVRNITNGRHWKTKEPLNLFYRLGTCRKQYRSLRNSTTAESSCSHRDTQEI